jgi:protein-glutamine gamma-glutamyltransferase
MVSRSSFRPKFLAPWSDRLKSQPREAPEESLWLRILAQSLVVIGILATDTAAETTMGLWAIPASIAGASWSWSCRHKRNIAVKFLLAIGMIVALIAFFTSLLAGRELNDTRLALAELLVQVQVLHSFDLPRRKDLGYSMIIGLILLGVACTLSQTMLFGLWMLLFLAIALPVLVLDYRSRLGLGRWRLFAQPLPGTPAPQRWKGLPLNFGVILSLGLLIFALMPRLPGYQIRSFPMSAPIETQQQFDNERVINPGYVRGGQGQGNGVRSGRGGSPETGAGEMDSTTYSGFNTVMNQNLRGRMQEQVVMRVRSQAAGFWRVIAFDRYTGQGWEASRNDKTQTLERSPWNYQFFPPQKVRLNKTKQVVQTYTMVADLPNVIPALDQPKEVYFPTQQIAIDHEGGLRSPVALTEGLTYTVISDVPYRDRTRLQKAQSQFRINDDNPYAVVPDRIRPKLQKLAEELLGQANSPITSDYEKALFLAQALKQRYTIQPNLPFLDNQEDLVEAFLFKYKGGYPDHFATVLTVLLRSIGMSTRLATGFSPGQFNPFTGYYIVKNTDAYAITEVYLHKYGWFSFDSIPGHALIPPSIEENQTFTVLQNFWKWVAGWLPSPVVGWLNWLLGGMFSALALTIGRFLALFTQGWLGWLTGLLGLTLLAFGGWMGWQGWRNWQRWRQLQRLEPVERLYQQWLDWLGIQGWVKRSAQTPWEYARSVQTKGATIAVVEPLHAITATYVNWRYGGQSVDLAPLQQQFQKLQQQQQRSRIRQRLANIQALPSRLSR